MSDNRFVFGYCLEDDGSKTCQAFPVEQVVDNDTAVAIVAKEPVVASNEKTTCFDLINYLTGDIITADYFCISSDVDSNTTIPDTFGTFDGTTVTFPDGTSFIPQSDTAGTFDGTTITFPDGTVYTPQPDTSGTWDGNSIIFPDGTVYTPPAATQLSHTDGNNVPDNTVQPSQRYQDGAFSSVVPLPAATIHRECNFVNLPRLVEDILNPDTSIVNGTRTYDLTDFGVPEDACAVEVYIYTAASALDNATARSTFTFVQQNGYLVQANADAGVGLNGGQNQTAFQIRGTTLTLNNINVMGQDDPDWTPTNRLLIRIGGYDLPIHV
jgi:hypothetical protein